MMPMMPNISVSPLATRNSSRPYCTAFRHWIRNMTGSTKPLRLQAAAAGRICQRLDGNALAEVLLALDLEQVDVLDGVVGLGQGELAARAVDGGAAHGAAHRFLLGDIALDRLEARGQQLGG